MALVLEQFPEQFYRGGIVPPLLHEDIKDFSFLVDGAPHEHALTAYSGHHLVEMPGAVGTSALMPDVSSDCGTEIPGPVRLADLPRPEGW